MGGWGPLRLQAPGVLDTVLSRVLHWGPHLPQEATSLSELQSEPHVPNPQVTWILGPRPASVGSLLLGLQSRARVESPERRKVGRAEGVIILGAPGPCPSSAPASPGRAPEGAWGITSRQSRGAS